MIQFDTQLCGQKRRGNKGDIVPLWPVPKRILKSAFRGVSWQD